MNLNDDIVLRKNLFKMLDENSSKKLIAVIAPAGYGKTTLISSYIRTRSKPNIWIDITPRTVSFLSFLTRLINGFRYLSPKFGDRLLETIAAAGTSIELTRKIRELLPDLLTLFVDDHIYFFKDKHILIIDDFHLLEAQDSDLISTFVSLLLSENLPTLQLIITSRTEPSIGINILKAKREILYLSADALRFNEQETSELIEQYYPDSSDIVLPSKLGRSLEGWITGIHLVLQTGLKNVNIYENIATIVNESLYGFFIEEIWNNLNQPVKAFLLMTSQTEYFSSRLCKEIFGITNAEEFISYLLKRNIFIVKHTAMPQGKNESVYSYNDYFKNFLKRQYSISTSPKESEQNYRKIAEYCKKMGEYENSINYFLEGQLFIEAIELIKEKYGQSQSVESLQKIELWLKKIPATLLFQHPEVMFINAYILMNLYFETGKAKDIIDSALNVYKDYDNKVKFTLLKAELTFNLIELEKLCSELEEYIEEKIETEYTLRLNYMLGKLLYRTDAAKYDKAFSKLQFALEISERTGDSELKPEIFMLLGNLSQDRGEFEKSLFYRRKSIELSNNIYQKMQAYSNLAGLEIHTGGYEKAYETLKEMHSLYERFPLSSLKRFVLKTEANLFYECGDHETCLNKFEELIKIEDSINFKSFLWYNHLMVGLQLYYTDMQDYALQRFDIAESFLQNNENERRLLVNQGKAISYLRKNSGENNDLIEKFLLSIYNYYSQNNLKVVEAQVSFYLASFYLRTNQYETSQLFLKNAFDRSIENDLVAFLERELPFHRDLFDFAVSEGINKTMAMHICNKFMHRALFPWISEPYRYRLTHETNKLTDIKLVSFGKTELFLRANFIPEDKWIRKKSKILLVYLMSDPNRIHTKDEIIDLFFDDMPAEKADMAYHSAIYNIRTALKIYDIKSDKPKRSKDKTYDYNPQYILYEDKTLRLNPDFYYTSDNVEFEKLYNKSRLPSLSIEEKITHSVKAIEIYKGDFLPGYYDSWCEELRVKYKNMYITMCEELIKMHEAEIRYDEVIMYSELLLKEDKLNDSAHISIINAYAKLGNIKMAKSRYEIMLKIYDEELGEKPQPNTLDKIALILSQVAGPP